MMKQLNNKSNSQFVVLPSGTCENSGPNLSEFTLILFLIKFHFNRE
jgi:hypothetical protein